MKPGFWGVIAFLITAAVTATPASAGDIYVAAGAQNGDAIYLALRPDGTFSDPESLQVSMNHQISGYSFGNGIGDFNNDGELDYILALGRFGGNIYIFPKTGPGNQFDPPVWAGSWTDGAYPADMAVADFNGDGNLDFVLNYFLSPHCGLYLGDGAFGFAFTLLPDTTPMSAIGMDAADFDNDGLADFVIAPRSNGPLIAYLGQPDGSFKKVISDRAPSVSIATGIAAADFVEDPDGFVDLAVSSANKLEIYIGYGDGTFDLYQAYDVPLNSSPLDNGDFDGDGHQDLVVADFGADNAGVAVLLGDGQGQFEHDATHLGQNIGFLKAVTALPYLSNKAPVAQLTPETITVTVGETVEWDASQSFDEDGTIVSYEWDFGEGAVAPMGINPMAVAGTADNSGGPQSSYVYYDSGNYWVTLKVTDDQGATATVKAEVQVEPLAVDVYFSPRRLNLKSKGKWITATIQLPSGYYAGMIDTDSLYLVPEGKARIKARSVYGHRHFNEHHKKNYRRTRQLEVKFDRQALIAALDGATGETSLRVMGGISIDVANMGNISTNVARLEFSGTGIVSAYEEKKKSSSKQYFFQQMMQFFSKGRSK